MSDAFSPNHILECISQKLNAQQNKTGLYVVATPIGNIFDITLRALHILKSANCIFAEDTRVTKKLLSFYGIQNKLVSCHEYNETDDKVTSLLQSDGIYALVSDAGTPTISDPGYRIINWCIEHDIDVFPIPGASSIIASISVAGLPTDNFAFHGFLPAKMQARKKAIENIANETMTMIFLESPKRIIITLQEMLNIFGNRTCCVCREITKLFEEYKRGTIAEILEYFTNNEPIGEFVLIVSGKTEETFNENSYIDELSALLETMSVKNAADIIHTKYNISKNNAYKKALEIKGN